MTSSVTLHPTRMEAAATGFASLLAAYACYLVFVSAPPTLPLVLIGVVYLIIVYQVAGKGGFGLASLRDKVIFSVGAAIIMPFMFLFIGTEIGRMAGEHAWVRIMTQSLLALMGGLWAVCGVAILSILLFEGIRSLLRKR